MGHHKEEDRIGHHHSSDDSSDDEGKSLEKSAKKKTSSKGKESDDRSSSSSSSNSSSKSGSHLHHHQDRNGDDDGARALGEEEEGVSRNGDEDNALEGSLQRAAVPGTNGIQEIDHGAVSAGEKASEEGGQADSAVVERDEGIREESGVSDAPVYDKFLVETSLKDDQKVAAKEGKLSVGVDEASSDKRGSGEKYNIVLSETVEGIHDEGNCDAPESTEEIVVPELVEEIAKSSEKRESSDAVVDGGEGEGHADSTSMENAAPGEAPEESELEGIDNAHEEDVGSEAVKSEAMEETVVDRRREEESVKDVAGDISSEQSFVSEKRAASLDDLEGGEQKGVPVGAVFGGEAEGHAEKRAPGETEEEPVEIEANGISVEGEISSDGPTNLEPGNSNELEGKSGLDDQLEVEDGAKEPQSVHSQRDLSVELGSPLEHQRRLMRQFATPSPPKRENSVYKIVMALEGLQVGEKCIHGEIDHGICHQRYGDRRMSSSPSFSGRAYRETSTPLTDGDESATPDGNGENAEVRVRNGDKSEVDSDWSFVQHDSQSGLTTQQTATIKTETYTDTVVFRRDDGFLPRTPGKSPLSGSQSMRAVFNQADAFGSTTPKLKIVHEFPAEKSGSQESLDGANTSTLASLSVEGESEVERILRLQETHDLVCPVCRSCITKRVILRKRKRTTVISTDKWETEVRDEEEENAQEQAHDNVGDGDTVVEQYEDYGCLGCFTFLFRRERSVQRTQVVEVSAAAETPASASGGSTPQTTDQSAVRLPEPLAASPPALTDEDYDNRCLPIFFTWKRKTTSPADAEVVAPLLSKVEKKTLLEESSEEVLQTQSRDVPVGDPPSETQEPAASEIQQSPAFEIQPSTASDILELPAAPGAVEGVQLPVVVVESREDRLCFPFLWRRASTTTRAQSELVQPLLAKEDVEHQSDVVEHHSDVVEQQLKQIDQERGTKEKSIGVKQRSKEIKQQSDEVKQHSEDVEDQTEDFSRIEDDLWMRGELLLEVSVPPQEELSTPGSSRTPDLSETAAKPDTSFKAIRVTEAERRVDCLCFPSWSSSETKSEETESSRITNSQQGAVISSASGTEAAGYIQTSTSVKGSENLENIQTSPILEEVVVPVASGSEAPEIISSTALKEALSSVTSGTEGAEIISTSPLSKGAVLPVASVTEDREAQRASLNCVDCMDILIPSYPWGSPGTGSRKEVLGRAEETPESDTSTQFRFSTGDQVVEKDVMLPEQVVSESPPKESQGVIVVAQTSKGSGLAENEISAMKTEDSRCLPLLLPTISWRRQELTTKDMLYPSSKTKTAETKSSVTSEKQSSVASEINSIVAVGSQLSGTAEANISQEKVAEKELKFGDIEVSRNQKQQIEQIYNDNGAEIVDEEEVPLVRRPPAPKHLTPSKVEPLPAEEGQRVSVDTLESSLPEVLDKDIIFSQDLTRTPNLAGMLPVDETYEEESKEKGSWNCCLPSYTQLSYQPIEDGVTGEQAAPASSGRAPSSQVSDESKFVSLEVSRETTIDARITTQTTTTKSHTEATNGETIDGVRIDTSVSYVHASVEHDNGAIEGKLHLDDHPTLSLQPADKLSAAPMLEEPKHVTQPPLGPTYSTGYAALAQFLEDEEENADEDAPVTEWLADSSRQDAPWKGVKPLTAVPEVEHDCDVDVSGLSSSYEEDDGVEIKSEAVTKVELPPVLSDSVKEGIGREIARVDVQRAEVPMPPSLEEEYRSGCLPKTKWLWGRPKLTSEEAHLREPLLGKDNAQEQESGPILQRDTEVDSKDFGHATAQQIQEETGMTKSSTAVRVTEEERCSCLPWSGRRYSLEAQLQEPLLGRETTPQIPRSDLLERDAEVDSKSDSSAHVTLQQTHEVTHTTTTSTAERRRDEEECNCFPWSGRYKPDSAEIDTTVTVTADDTVIEVEGTDASSTLAAARAAAEDAGMMDGELIQEPEYLKSIVYGGLDVSLTSLGVVASAAGGDAKTRNVLALGLANLIFGFIAFYYKVQDLHKDSPARFQESVGPRFWINGPLAMLSFLFFGALPVLTFGFSFRKLNDHDYKMAATVLVSIIAIVLLGCGKVSAKMTELSYRRTVSTLIFTGIAAAVAGFYTGEYISKLLEKYGILDE